MTPNYFTTAVGRRRPQLRFAATLSLLILIAAIPGAPLLSFACGALAWRELLILRNARSVMQAHPKHVALMNWFGKQTKQESGSYEMLLGPVGFSPSVFAIFCTVLEDIPTGVCILDSTGEVVFANKGVHELTGIELELLYTNGISVLEEQTSPEHVTKLRRALGICKLGDRTLVHCPLLHRHGLKLWLELRAAPLYDSAGAFCGSLLVLLDVTTLVKSKRQIEEQNRDLQDFTTMVSHDLKAPIFTIQGMAAALGQDFSNDLGQNGAEQLSHISAAAARLETLAASVVRYNRITDEASAEASTELEVVLENVLMDHGHAVSEAKAEIIRLNHLPCVFGDEVRWYQIFSNLVGNALKYRASDRLLQLRISAESELPFVVLSFADNGIGIPEDKLSSVFRPYFRAHSQHAQGTGVGLACVRKIVSAFGGEVWVESNSGVGSTFFVRVRQADSFSVAD